MDNHINQVGSVMLVEKFQELVVHQKPLTNKAPGFFWFLVGAFNISDIFYKIQNSN